MTCLCSDTVTILWCRARENNKRSLRNKCPSISSSSILPHLDHAQHWRRHRSQDTEQEGWNLLADRVVNVLSAKLTHDNAELIIHQLGLSCSSRSVSTPSEKPKPGVDLSSVLNRSATMRPDLQFPSKELARWMHAPTVRNLEALKRVNKYLIGYGRLVQEFARQVEEPPHVVVFTDSDHVGCLKARKVHHHPNCSTVPTCHVPPALRKESWP